MLNFQGVIQENTQILSVHERAIAIYLGSPEQVWFPTSEGGLCANRVYLLICATMQPYDYVITLYYLRDPTRR